MSQMNSLTTLIKRYVFNDAFHSPYLAIQIVNSAPFVTNAYCLQS